MTMGSNKEDHGWVNDLDFAALKKAQEDLLKCGLASLNELDIHMVTHKLSDSSYVESETAQQAQAAMQEQLSKKMMDYMDYKIMGYSPFQKPYPNGNSPEPACSNPKCKHHARKVPAAMPYFQVHAMEYAPKDFKDFTAHKEAMTAVDKTETINRTEYHTALGFKLKLCDDCMSLIELVLGH